MRGSHVFVSVHEGAHVFFVSKHDFQTVLFSTTFSSLTDFVSKQEVKMSELVTSSFKH